MKQLQMKRHLTWMNFFNLLMIANLMGYVYYAFREIHRLIHISKTSHIGYGISEFLINWKGGYVRRGLVGELLYRLCEATGWQPVYVIVMVCIASCIAFAVIFFLILKKGNLSWWIMFLPFTLGGMPVIRKDHVCMLFTLLILYILKTSFKFLWVKLLCIYILSCLLLHIHEAFFFVIVPFTVCYLYFYEFSGWSNKSAKIILSTVPLLLPFLLICHYHGDESIARIIHASWIDLCPSLREYQFTHNDSIGAIGWETCSTIRFHLQQSYLIHNPLIFILIYYLISRFQILSDSKRQDRIKEQSVFNVIFLFQFIMLVPLFTILSCDVDRICLYWTVSSVCIYCILNSEISQIISDKGIILDSVKKIDSFFDDIFKPSKKLLCLLILFITIPQIGSSFGNTSVYDGLLKYPTNVLYRIMRTVRSGEGK